MAAIKDAVRRIIHKFVAIAGFTSAESACKSREFLVEGSGEAPFLKKGASPATLLKSAGFRAR